MIIYTKFLYRYTTICVRESKIFGWVATQKIEDTGGFENQYLIFESIENKFFLFVWFMLQTFWWEHKFLTIKIWIIDKILFWENMYLFNKLAPTRRNDLVYVFVLFYFGANKNNISFKNYLLFFGKSWKSSPTRRVWFKLIQNIIKFCLLKVVSWSFSQCGFREFYLIFLLKLFTTKKGKLN